MAKHLGLNQPESPQTTKKPVPTSTQTMHPPFDLSRPLDVADFSPDESKKLITRRSPACKQQTVLDPKMLVNRQLHQHRSAEAMMMKAKSLPRSIPRCHQKILTREIQFRRLINHLSPFGKETQHMTSECTGKRTITQQRQPDPSRYFRMQAFGQVSIIWLRRQVTGTAAQVA